MRRRSNGRAPACSRRQLRLLPLDQARRSGRMRRTHADTRRSTTWWSDQRLQLDSPGLKGPRCWADAPASLAFSAAQVRLVRTPLRARARSLRQSPLRKDLVRSCGRTVWVVHSCWLRVHGPFDPKPRPRRPRPWTYWRRVESWAHRAPNLEPVLDFPRRYWLRAPCRPRPRASHRGNCFGSGHSCRSPGSRPNRRHGPLRQGTPPAATSRCAERQPAPPTSRRQRTRKSVQRRLVFRRRQLRGVFVQAPQQTPPRTSAPRRVPTLAHPSAGRASRWDPKPLPQTPKNPHKLRANHRP